MIQCPSVRSPMLLVLATITIAGGLLAHQDDPKAVYRPQPYSGLGYHTGVPWAPGAPSALPGGPGGIAAGPLGGTAMGGSFDASGISLLSWLSLPELGAGITSGSDCWGYTSPSGREYALITHSAGTTIVEITTPTQPVVVAVISGPTSLWRDVKTYQSHAYIVSEGGGGIQVVDLSGVDAGVATLVNSINTPAGTTAASHNVAIDEVSGFLYRCGGGSNGLRIYDLSNPASPTYVGAWGNRYVHDAQIVTYTTGPYAGMQVAFVCGGLNGGWVDTGLDILDVTNKTNITTLSQTIYATGQYSHQAWLSEDRQYLFLNDELDEDGVNVPTKTFVFDVSNLAAPVQLGDFTNGNPAIGHNVYTVGNLLFEANYRSGVRVFDVSNPLSPPEIAYFDTYPDDDAAQFNGLWGVYPYFPSGTFIGSDLERGLFVWALGEPLLLFDFPLGQPVTIDPSGGTSIVVDVLGNAGGILDPASVTLWVDAGAGFSPVSMAPLGGASFQGDFPPVACGTAATYYISASTTAGDTETAPSGAPGSLYETFSQLGETIATEDAMETDAGWIAGIAGDTATTGVWLRGDPVGTGAQPEDDHTPAGSQCWFTGQGPTGGGLGDADIDGGLTTLISPVYDLTTLSDPLISYWRWFSNNAGAAPGEDVLEVSISGDSGATWVPVETVGPTGPDSVGGWREHSFRPAALLPLTATMRLRFIAGDLGSGSVVEAAIDDLIISDLLCTDCNGNGIDDAADIASGTSSDANLDGVPDECAPPCPELFIRGDTNADGGLDLSDAITILGYLFNGGATPSPLARADLDGAGVVNIADAVQLLDYLFQSGPPPAPPFPNPGCP